jgi:hypothetical protein
MIFDGYENFLVERVIDLSRYIKDNDTGEDFHKNFFNEDGGSFFDDFNIKSLFSIFGSNIESKRDGLIEQLQHQGVEHVLLILSQKFINSIINRKKKISRVRVKPREFKQNFIDKFYSEFTSNDIGCSIVLTGSREKKGIEILESWFNIKELQKSLTLGINEAYLLGFKDIKVESGREGRAISLELNNRYLTIGDDSSVLIGNHSTFRFHLPKDKSIIKITNSEDAIVFISENIDEIKSNNERLQEEYFDSEMFDDFEIEIDDLRDDDIDISFEKTTIMLSTTIHRESPKRDKSRVKKQQDKQIVREDVIDTDIDETPTSSYINLKNRHIVNLNRFITAFESRLIEVHYHLVKIRSQFILVGGSNIDPKHKPIAKVVAKIDSREFKITNLTPQPIRFKIGDNKIEYNTRRDISKPRDNYINTDEDEQPQNSQEVLLNMGESYIFDKKIEFPNSAIYYIDSGVEIRYSNFIIGSFNNKLEFNRGYYKHFSSGNIIDGVENLDFGGRVFEDGTKKILGSSISSRPLILSLRGEQFTLLNSIKSNYTITLSRDNIDRELSYQEDLTILKDELLSKRNSISINKDTFKLIEISIIPN